MKIKAAEISDIIRRADQRTTTARSTSPRPASSCPSATASPASTGSTRSWRASWSSSPTASAALVAQPRRRQRRRRGHGRGHQDPRGRSRFRRTGRDRSRCRSGEALLGRVVDALGAPLDGKGDHRRRPRCAASRSRRPGIVRAPGGVRAAPDRHQVRSTR